MLERYDGNGQRTRGLLHLPRAVLHTLELPWKGNAPRISCIPSGIYECVPHGWEPNATTKFKRVYRLLGTGPRSGILIHSGNTVKDIEGCILVGVTADSAANPFAVRQSVAALDLLRAEIGQNSFELEIVELPEDVAEAA